MKQSHDLILYTNSPKEYGNNIYTKAMYKCHCEMHTIDLHGKTDCLSAAILAAVHGVSAEHSSVHKALEASSLSSLTLRPNSRWRRSVSVQRLSGDDSPAFSLGGPGDKKDGDDNVDRGESQPSINAVSGGGGGGGGKGGGGNAGGGGGGGGVPGEGGLGGEPLGDEASLISPLGTSSVSSSSSSSSSS
ncbi:hypothetical protein FHG87_017253 [Trinorchestia longiramus]|nr:hypothetical protein FHG87_017253 [Trinorchestia longiramus]